MHASSCIQIGVHLRIQIDVCEVIGGRFFSIVNQFKRLHADIIRSPKANGVEYIIESIGWLFVSESRPAHVTGGDKQKLSIRLWKNICVAITEIQKTCMVNPFTGGLQLTRPVKFPARLLTPVAGEN